MSDPTTLADLFELAIQAERNAEALYDRFAQLFAAHPKVADFWHQYARQEAAHADWLTQLVESLDADQLDAPADPTILNNAQRLLSFSLDKVLETVHTLDDAYQLATEMENGETNAIFQFLTEHVAPSEQLRAFLRGQLRDHLSKLMVDFPLEFQSAARRQQVSIQAG